MAKPEPDEKPKAPRKRKSVAADPLAVDPLAIDREALRAYALSFPETHEDHPWGDTALKVRKKVFVFLNPEESEHLGLSVKLPESGGEALALPFCTPTGYGLGKHGWVSVRFEPGETVLLGLMKEWIAESYCAVAPKTLVKAWRAAGGGA